MAMEFKNRNQLLRLCMDRGLSLERMEEVVHSMAGCSEEEKERLAGELIPVVESGIYDCELRCFWRKRELRDDWNRLLETGNLSCEAVCPIIEKGLGYLELRPDAVREILSCLKTEEHLRQMFGWITELIYIPEEADCLAKAKEIASAVSAEKDSASTG